MLYMNCLLKRIILLMVKFVQYEISYEVSHGLVIDIFF